jgi:predicted component of type VI protein secretion system
MPAQLVALTEGPNILLDKPIMLFGRHPECDIQIDSRKISRRHCCIAQVGDYLVVRDLGSTNGIRINGTRVLEGKLRAGDELTIGNHRYQIRWDVLGVGASAVRPGPARAERPPPAHSAAPVFDDDLLEECDEPVPLEEPVNTPPKRPSLRKPSPAKAPELDPHHTVKPMQAPDDEPSLVLPDHLELAPASDVISPAPRPERPSQ